MGHSLASATTGLVGQPQLQDYIQKQLSYKTHFSTFTTGPDSFMYSQSNICYDD